jgi:hypothetical protein
LPVHPVFLFSYLWLEMAFVVEDGSSGLLLAGSPLYIGQEACHESQQG